ncbi:reverse transcriptase domain-containing protein [Serratia fonticola]|uniref:reverse transcriptase domain-containing protein n=1 Tax=Serratia fonticola TaxID=47917 RepID=UPI003BB58B88
MLEKQKIETLFNSYFNFKKNFSDFNTIRTYEEVKKISFLKNNKTIYKCSGRLKSIQTFLDKFIFREMPIRKDIVFSYRKEVNIADAVRPHSNSNFIYRTDISNFFSSINPQAIKNKLLENKECINFIDSDEIIRYSDRILELCTIDNQLPIGFPSSPSISNFCFIDYDNAISNYCVKNSLIYTRYADDLIISSVGEINKEELSSVIASLVSTDENMRFNLNYKKTKIITRKYERHILGVSILEDGKLTVSRKMKMDIEVRLHLLKTNRQKLIDYTNSNEMDSILSIAGTLSQINNIDKDYLYHLRKKYGNSIISKLLKGKELLK